MQKLEAILLIILIIALVDSVYLVLVYFAPSELACPDIGIINCGSVLSSRFGTIFGIPTAFYGLLWAIVALAMFIFARKAAYALAWYTLGLGGVTYSITSMVSLGEICAYCSLLDILIITSLALLYEIQQSK
jgi:uncharacterized membrane protein